LKSFIAQEFCFERRLKVGDVVFGGFLFAIEVFYCSRVCFERR
jgi:hypothetical protein